MSDIPLLNEPTTGLTLDLEELTEEQLYAAIDLLRRTRFGDIEKGRKARAAKAVGTSTGAKRGRKRKQLAPMSKLEEAIALAEALGVKLPDAVIAKLKAK